jgi:hypothetical protein
MTESEHIDIAHAWAVEIERLVIAHGHGEMKIYPVEGVLAQARTLTDADGAAPMPDAQHEELDRRLDDLDQDGPVGIDWDEAMRRIHGKNHRSQ